MPRAKISDAFGITVEIEAGEASYAELLAAASTEFERANRIVQKRPVGGTGFATQIASPAAPKPRQRNETGPE